MLLKSPPLAGFLRQGRVPCPEFDDFSAQYAKNLRVPSALFPFSGESTQRLGSIALRDRGAADHSANFFRIPATVLLFERPYVMAADRGQHRQTAGLLRQGIQRKRGDARQSPEVC